MRGTGSHDYAVSGLFVPKLRAIQFDGAPRAPGALYRLPRGPARAVRCAAAIADAVQRLGIAARIGIHTGEIDLTGDDVTGIAVHIAARVAAEAAAGETVVSRTVRDLVAGSGLRFEDRGLHELKGLPEQLHLYTAR